jgi:hypothetical protein
MHESAADALEKCADTLEDDRNFHAATVKSNTRITADGWYQDVRHFEFEFGDDIQYVDPPLANLSDLLRDNSYAPGDVAVIHPIASPIEIETFLNMMNWGNIADSPFEIERTMQGTSSIPSFSRDHIRLTITRSVTPRSPPAYNNIENLVYAPRRYQCRAQTFLLPIPSLFYNGRVGTREVGRTSFNGGRSKLL